MLKKLAAEALGISDIGKIMDPSDFNKVESDDYVMHEDGEKIYFLIKSKTDEYCFTNLALIHVDGTSAVSSKRLLKRYDYYQHSLSNVLLETAGTMDLDVEIKFKMGEQSFSVDVDRKQLEKLKDLYKTLIKMSQMMQENNRMKSYRKSSLETASKVLETMRAEESVISDEFKKLNEYVFDWQVESHRMYVRKDFGEVFERYINN